MLALTVVGQASADDDSDYEREGTVIVVRGKGHHKTRPVRATQDPPGPGAHHSPVRYERDPAVYDSRRVSRHRAYELAAARQNLDDQRRDLEQIVRIANRWEQASADHNPHALRKVERRLDDWIEREIIESRHNPRDQSYVQRLRELKRELAATDGGYGHGRGYGRVYGRGWRRHQAYKANVLSELVELAERQVYRAQARLRHPVRFSFAYR